MDWFTPQLGCLLFAIVAPFVWAYSYYKMVRRILREQREKWGRLYEERRRHE